MVFMNSIYNQVMLPTPYRPNIRLQLWALQRDDKAPCEKHIQIIKPKTVIGTDVGHLFWLAQLIKLEIYQE